MYCCCRLLGYKYHNLNISVQSMTSVSLVLGTKLVDQQRILKAIVVSRMNDSGPSICRCWSDVERDGRKSIRGHNLLFVSHFLHLCTNMDATDPTVAAIQINASEQRFVARKVFDERETIISGETTSVRRNGPDLNL